jgi:hypothetical protein
VWTWRDAIRQAKVPTLTKTICWALANYISDVGEGCYPGVKRLMADTGMSNRSVATHLQNAVDAGLLHIERAERRAGRYGRTTYLPRFPTAAVLAGERTSGRGTSPSERSSRGGRPREPSARHRVNLPHGISPGEPTNSPKSSNRGTEGADGMVRVKTLPAAAVEDWACSAWATERALGYIRLLVDELAPVLGIDHRSTRFNIAALVQRYHRKCKRGRINDHAAYLRTMVQKELSQERDIPLAALKGACSRNSVARAEAFATGVAAEPSADALARVRRRVQRLGGNPDAMERAWRESVGGRRFDSTAAADRSLQWFETAWRRRAA